MIVDIDFSQYPDSFDTLKIRSYAFPLFEAPSSLERFYLTSRC